MVDKKYQFNPIKAFDLSKEKILKVYKDMLKIRSFG
jgi:TPP-dependent pyruvate/acetoin dehydrogenase alpha subunit